MCYVFWLYTCFCSRVLRCIYIYLRKIVGTFFTRYVYANEDVNVVYMYVFIFLYIGFVKKSVQLYNECFVCVLCVLYEYC